MIWVLIQSCNIQQELQANINIFEFQAIQLVFQLN